jgi:hypothetical protein
MEVASVEGGLDRFSFLRPRTGRKRDCDLFTSSAGLSALHGQRKEKGEEGEPPS